MRRGPVIGAVADRTSSSKEGHETGEDGLDEKGRDKDPALLGTKVAMKVGEEKGADSEEDYGKETAGPGLSGEVFGLAADA